MSGSEVVRSVLEHGEVIRIRRQVERAWAAAFALALGGAGALVLHLQQRFGMAWLLLAGIGLLVFLALLGIQRRFWLGPLTARNGRRIVTLAEREDVDPAALLSASTGREDHHFTGVMLRAAGIRRLAEPR